MFALSFNPYRGLAIFLCVLSFILFGCGSEESVPATVLPIATSMTALNDFKVVRPSELADVDLLALVEANGRVMIKEVFTEQSRCPNPELTMRGFTVYPETGVACNYRYIVESGLLQASAGVTVLATRAEESILNALDHPMSLGGGVISFDLNELLGVDFPLGYALETVSLMSVQDVLAGEVDIDVDTNIIKYTPPNRTGYEVITYMLQNVDSTDFTVIGSIYITISQKLNEAPLIGERELYYSPTGEQEVIARQSSVIDLETVGANITVAEGKDYHLVHVQSLTATVTAKNDLEGNSGINNKQIDFQTAAPGEHVVSYIVADDFGGFSMGLIRVHVGALLNPITWDDLVVGGRTFTAPALYTPQLTALFNVTPEWDNSVNNNAIPVTTINDLPVYSANHGMVIGNTVAAFRSISAAKAYCNTRGGRLPSYNELLTIGSAPGAVESVGVDEFSLINTAPGWPKGMPYALDISLLADDGITQKPTADEFAWGRGMYVSCVKHTLMELDLIATEFKLGSNKPLPLGALITEFSTQDIEHNIIGGTLKLKDTTGSITDYSDITTSRIRPIFSNIKTSGSAIIRFSDKSNASNYIDTPTLNFLAGEDSILSNLVVYRDNAKANGRDYNYVLLTVLDSDGNRVAGLKAKATVNGGASIQSEAITDASGQALFWIRSSSQGTYDVDVTFAGIIKNETVSFSAVRYDWYEMTRYTVGEGANFYDSNIGCLNKGWRLPDFQLFTYIKNRDGSYPTNRNWWLSDRTTMNGTKGNNGVWSESQSGHLNYQVCFSLLEVR
jgi:hypothetical protein